LHTIRRHPAVRGDFEEAFFWYQDQSYGLGYEFAASFRLALSLIQQSPLIYARRLDEIRRINLRRFPYGLFYFLDEDTVVVLALLHGKRDQDVLLRYRKEGLAGPSI